MTKSIDRAPFNPGWTRRETLRALGASAVVFGTNIAAGSALAQGGGDNVLTEALVLRDPDIPVAGNAAGDITIVEYFDYQCPYFAASSSPSCGRWSRTMARFAWY
jgi:protein-disulfide isomerase